MRSLRYLLFAIWFAGLAGCLSFDAADKPEYTNALINSSSPYLLQHAHNPVNWRPWGEEALQQARAEDKMLLISVGYAACHWCHVMERESFEDTTVARIMNEHFISIKVDREERPDIDAIYMSACQMATDGSCGWPLNAFALPDGRPIWAGTYFPRKQWIEILQYFIALRKESREKLDDYAEQLATGLRELEALPPVKEMEDFPTSATAKPVVDFLNKFDREYGGRKAAQKFPMPNIYQWLLQYYLLESSDEVLQAVQLTLDQMMSGGIYDQLGGGFSRYTVDPRWEVPHFEKMLYDNAQLAGLYARAYQITGAERYRRVLEETLAFVQRELTGPLGNFYSSLDADSEGEEGKYYVWTQAEIEALLTPPEAALIKSHYQISEKGNWEAGKNILRTPRPLGASAEALSMEVSQARRLLESARSKLMIARAQRIRPGLDDKSLCSWNALMLEAYTDAYRATGQDQYRDIALRNGQFILEHLLQPDGRLLRNFKDGTATINGFLDDYAHTIGAFIALYEITFEESWLLQGQQLADYAIRHFQDPDSGFFFYTSDLDPPLLVRKTALEDNVIPSSNSSMARALYQLGHYFDRKPYLATAKKMMSGMRERALESDQAGFFSNWNQLYLELAHPTYEVAIVGRDYESLRREMQRTAHPQVLYLGGAREGTLSLLKGKLVEEETYIYVCLNKVCRLPVQSTAAAEELIGF